MGQSLKVASEVRAEQLKRDFRTGLGDGIDALFVVVCSAVREVVSIDHRDHGMTEVHRSHGFGEVLRFIGVKRWRAFDGANGTKPAAPCALLTCDHERGVSAGPAFVDVGATCFFADGVEFVVLDGRFRAVECHLLFATR